MVSFAYLLKQLLIFTLGHEINTILVQNVPFQRTSWRQGRHRRLGEQPREVQMGQAKRAGKGKGGSTHMLLVKLST